MQDAAVAHHEIAILEDERRVAEHRRLVGLLRVNRYVGPGAGAEMPTIAQAQQSGGRRAGHDSDFGKRVFAPDRRQRGHGHRGRG